MNPSHSLPWLPLATAAGGAFVLAGLALYVTCGPDVSGSRARTRRARRRRKGDPPGLANLGNTCFVNAVLQALAVCPSFATWLQQFEVSEETTTRQVETEDVDGKTKKKEEKTLTVHASLLKTLRYLNNDEQEEEVNSTLPLFKALRVHGWHINGGEEQDAHEMLQVLLTSLEEELQKREVENRKNRFFLHALTDSESDGGEDNGNDAPQDLSLPSPCSSEPSSSSTFVRGHRRHRSSGVFTRCGSVELSCESVRQQTSTPQRRLSTPFSGRVTSRVTFHDGRAKSPIASSTFNNVTLTLPRSEGFFGISSAVTLDTLLQMYISRESVEGSGEEDGGDRKPIVKQFTFGRLPQCLCFHIQRTTYVHGRPSKRDDFVSFPWKIDMSRYVYTSQIMKEKRVQEASPLSDAPPGSSSLGSTVHTPYRLCSVVVHLGEINSGHNVTYRRGPVGGAGEGKWFLTSDDFVEEVDQVSVLKTHAYMLFYEKEA